MNRKHPLFSQPSSHSPNNALYEQFLVYYSRKFCTKTSIFKYISPSWTLPILTILQKPLTLHHLLTQRPNAPSLTALLLPIAIGFTQFIGYYPPLGHFGCSSF